MNAITLGLICRTVFGVIDVAIMIPVKVETRRKKVEALAGALS